MSMIVVILTLSAGPPVPPAPSETREQLIKRLAALPDRALVKKLTQAEKIDLLVKSTLGRAPTRQERAHLTQHLEKMGATQARLRDLTWALASSMEFLKKYRLTSPADALKFGHDLQAVWETPLWHGSYLRPLPND